MKKSVFIIVLLLTVLISSCKKEDLQTIQEQKIADIIPSKYLDTLKNLGITIHEGTTPPNIEGIYDLSPVKLKKSNLSGDTPGMSFASAKVKFYAQNNDDFSIQCLAKSLLNLKDSSLATAVSGSGNDFTVYGKVKSNAGPNSAIFAIILTGTIDGSTLKNIEWGLINIDNSNGNGAFILEGQARLVYDTDFSSPSIASLKLNISDIPKGIKCPAAK